MRTCQKCGRESDGHRNGQIAVWGLSGDRRICEACLASTYEKVLKYIKHLRKVGHHTEATTLENILEEAE